MHHAAATGMELVAICDNWKEGLKRARKAFNVATFTDYDKFLDHKMDAVVTANYFHEHAPFAIKALEAGKHVMSECVSCFSLAEGVALCEAVEKSGKIYMLAENYPYTAANIEMAKIYGEGVIGEVLYAEGEYLHSHPWEEQVWLSPGLDHWRNRLPIITYCTHSLAPLMVATNTMPVKVNGFAVPHPEGSKEDRINARDVGGMIMCHMDNGAVFRLAQGGFVDRIAYRYEGTRGNMSNVVDHVHGAWGSGEVTVSHNPWEVPEGDVVDKTYKPHFPAWAQAAAAAGHGGGDFFTSHYFAEAIRTGKQPFLDVYRGVVMSAVGFLGWRSVTEGNAAIEVPNFRSKRARKKVAQDRWSPFPTKDFPNPPPTSLKPGFKPSRKSIAAARKIWRGMGHTDL